MSSTYGDGIEAVPGSPKPKRDVRVVFTVPFFHRVQLLLSNHTDGELNPVRLKFQRQPFEVRTRNKIYPMKRTCRSYHKGTFPIERVNNPWRMNDKWDIMKSRGKFCDACDSRFDRSQSDMCCFRNSE